MSTIANFNINEFDDDTRDFIADRTARIRNLMSRSAQDIVDIGTFIAEVKETLEHGQFEAWLKQEFDLHPRMAQRFMNVAERFKNDNLSLLDFAPSALYLLAAPSTPDEAVDEAVERAEAGEHITHSTAQVIIESHQPETPSSDGPLVPPGNWYETWQIYKQRAPEMVSFATTGEDDSTYLAFEGDAVKVAKLLGLRLQKFTMPGDQLSLRVAIKIELNKPNAEGVPWLDVLFKLLGSNLNFYPEMDPEIVKIADSLRMNEVNETTDRESEDTGAAILYSPQASGNGPAPSIDEIADSLGVTVSEDDDIHTPAADDPADLERARALYEDVSPLQVGLDYLEELFEAVFVGLDSMVDELPDGRDLEVAHFLRNNCSLVRRYAEMITKINQRPAKMQQVREMIYDATSEVELMAASRQITDMRIVNAAIKNPPIDRELDELAAMVQDRKREVLES